MAGLQWDGTSQLALNNISETFSAAVSTNNPANTIAWSVMTTGNGEQSISNITLKAGIGFRL